MRELYEQFIAYSRDYANRIGDLHAGSLTTCLLVSRLAFPRR